MELVNLLLMVGVLLGAITMVYMTKNPQAKGEPFGRTRTLMQIPMFMSACCLIAAIFLFLTRR